MTDEQAPPPDAMAQMQQMMLAQAQQVQALAAQVSQLTSALLAPRPVQAPAAPVVPVDEPEPNVDPSLLAELERRIARGEQRLYVDRATAKAVLRAAGDSLGYMRLMPYQPPFAYFRGVPVHLDAPVPEAAAVVPVKVKRAPRKRPVKALPPFDVEA